jgi:hypothetical protein
MVKENKNMGARANLNLIAPISNIARGNLLPDGCQFLMPDCSAIPGASQQYAAN